MKEVLTIITVLQFVIFNDDAFAQNIFYIKKQDSLIQINSMESCYFYNPIKENLDFFLLVKNPRDVGMCDPIHVYATFNSQLSIWEVSWINKRDSILIQKGRFNKNYQADGEFEVYKGEYIGKCYFKNGVKEGLETFKSTSGELNVRQYKNGVLDGACYSIIDDKFIKSFTQYKNGKHHGVDIAYWITENGISIHYSDMYINGKIIDGKYYIYNPDGTIFIEQNYKNGLKQGVQIRYYNGRTVEKQKYRNGTLIKELNK